MVPRPGHDPAAGDSPLGGRARQCRRPDHDRAARPERAALRARRTRLRPRAGRDPRPRRPCPDRRERHQRPGISQPEYAVHPARRRAERPDRGQSHPQLRAGVAPQPLCPRDPRLVCPADADPPQRRLPHARRRDRTGAQRPADTRGAQHRRRQHVRDLHRRRAAHRLQLQRRHPERDLQLRPLERPRGLERPRRQGQRRRLELPLERLRRRHRRRGLPARREHQREPTLPEPAPRLRDGQRAVPRDAPEDRRDLPIRGTGLPGRLPASRAAGPGADRPPDADRTRAGSAPLAAVHEPLRHQVDRSGLVLDSRRARPARRVARARRDYRGARHPTRLDRARARVVVTGLPRGVKVVHGRTS